MSEAMLRLGHRAPSTTPNGEGRRPRVEGDNGGIEARSFAVLTMTNMAKANGGTARGDGGPDTSYSAPPKEEAEGGERPTATPAG